MGTGQIAKVRARMSTDFLSYIRGVAAGYIAALRRLYPRLTAWVIFCRQRRQSKGVPAVRAHFYGRGAQRRTERESRLPLHRGAEIAHCVHGAYRWVKIVFKAAFVNCLLVVFLINLKKHSQQGSKKLRAAPDDDFHKKHLR